VNSADLEPDFAGQDRGGFAGGRAGDGAVQIFLGDCGEDGSFAGAGQAHQREVAACVVPQEGEDGGEGVDLLVLEFDPRQLGADVGIYLLTEPYQGLLVFAATLFLFFLLVSHGLPFVAAPAALHDGGDLGAEFGGNVHRATFVVQGPAIFATTAATICATSSFVSASWDAERRHIAMVIVIMP
jgi:hypothetical protein